MSPLMVARVWRRVSAALVLLGGIASGEEAASVDRDELFGSLGADNFTVREEAQRSLTDWAGEDFENRSAILLDKMQGSDDPEVKARCRAILKELVLTRFEEEGPGFIGIVMSRFLPQVMLDGKAVRGVGVEAVQPGTPADKFGLQAGDLLLKVDDQSLDDPNGAVLLQEYVSKAGAGAKVTVSLIRGGELKTIPLELMRCPLQVEYQRRVPAPIPGKPRNLQIPTEERLRELEFQRWLESRQTAGGRAGSSPVAPPSRTDAKPGAAPE